MTLKTYHEQEVLFTNEFQVRYLHSHYIILAENRKKFCQMNNRKVEVEEHTH